MVDYEESGVVCKVVVLLGLGDSRHWDDGNMVNP